MSAVVPDKGEAIWINLTPQAGREQMGHRPALVLSPAIYDSRSGLAVVCPITTQVKGYPFEVRVPDGLPVHGVVLADHIRSVDWRQRNAHYLCRLPDSVIVKVFDLLDVLFERQVR